METNKLSKEELNLIANMDERLKKLETLLDEALAKETPETLTQWLLSKRSIDPIKQVEEVEYLCEATPRCKEQCSVCKKEETYLFKQEQPKWKEGELAWLTKGKHCIGLITQILDGKATADQNGLIVKGLDTNEFTKPTHQEIEQHLTKIAIEKYPVGAVFKSVGYGIRQRVLNHNHIKYYKGELLINGACVWYGGEWATIVKEEAKERCKTSVVTNHLKYEVRVFGFETQEEARGAADKIKALLATL